MDVGESAYAALVREVREETGIAIVHADPFGLYSDPRYSVTYPNGDEVQKYFARAGVFPPPEPVLTSSESAP